MAQDHHPLAPPDGDTVSSILLLVVVSAGCFCCWLVSGLANSTRKLHARTARAGSGGATHNKAPAGAEASSKPATGPASDGIPSASSSPEPDPHKEEISAKHRNPKPAVQDLSLLQPCVCATADLRALVGRADLAAHNGKGFRRSASGSSASSPSMLPASGCLAQTSFLSLEPQDADAYASPGRASALRSSASAPASMQQQHGLVIDLQAVFAAAAKAEAARAAGTKLYKTNGVQLDKSADCSGNGRDSMARGKTILNPGSAISSPGNEQAAVPGSQSSFLYQSRLLQMRCNGKLEFQTGNAPDLARALTTTLGRNLHLHHAACAKTPAPITHANLLCVQGCVQLLGSITILPDAALDLLDSTTSRSASPALPAASSATSLVRDAVRDSCHEFTSLGFQTQLAMTVYHGCAAATSPDIPTTRAYKGTLSQAQPLQACALHEEGRAQSCPACIPIDPPAPLILTGPLETYSATARSQLPVAHDPGPAWVTPVCIAYSSEPVEVELTLPACTRAMWSGLGPQQVPVLVRVVMCMGDQLLVNTWRPVQLHIEQGQAHNHMAQPTVRFTVPPLCASSTPPGNTLDTACSSGVRRLPESLHVYVLADAQHHELDSDAHPHTGLQPSVLLAAATLAAAPAPIAHELQHLAEQMLAAATQQRHAPAALGASKGCVRAATWQLHLQPLMCDLVFLGQTAPAVANVACMPRLDAKQSRQVASWADLATNLLQFFIGHDAAVSAACVLRAMTVAGMQLRQGTQVVTADEAGKLLGEAMCPAARAHPTAAAAAADSDCAAHEGCPGTASSTGPILMAPSQAAGAASAPAWQLARAKYPHVASAAAAAACAGVMLMACRSILPLHHLLVRTTSAAAYASVTATGVARMAWWRVPKHPLALVLQCVGVVCLSALLVWQLLTPVSMLRAAGAWLASQHGRNSVAIASGSTAGSGTAAGAHIRSDVKARKPQPGRCTRSNASIATASAGQHSSAPPSWQGSCSPFSAAAAAASPPATSPPRDARAALSATSALGARITGRHATSRLHHLVTAHDQQLLRGSSCAFARLPSSDTSTVAGVCSAPCLHAPAPCPIRATAILSSRDLDVHSSGATELMSRKLEAASLSSDEQCAGTSAAAETHTTTSTSTTLQTLACTLLLAGPPTQLPLPVSDQHKQLRRGHTLVTLQPSSCPESGYVAVNCVLLAAAVPGTSHTPNKADFSGLISCLSDQPMELDVELLVRQLGCAAGSVLCKHNASHLPAASSCDDGGEAGYQPRDLELLLLDESQLQRWSDGPPATPVQASLLPMAAHQPDPPAMNPTKAPLHHDAASAQQEVEVEEEPVEELAAGADAQRALELACSRWLPFDDAQLISLLPDAVRRQHSATRRHASQPLSQMDGALEQDDLQEEGPLGAAGRATSYSSSCVVQPAGPSAAPAAAAGVSAVALPPPPPSFAAPGAITSDSAVGSCTGFYLGHPGTVMASAEALDPPHDAPATRSRQQLHKLSLSTEHGSSQASLQHASAAAFSCTDTDQLPAMQPECQYQPTEALMMHSACLPDLECTGPPLMFMGTSCSHSLASSPRLTLDVGLAAADLGLTTSQEVLLQQQQEEQQEHRELPSFDKLDLLVSGAAGKGGSTDQVPQTCLVLPGDAAGAGGGVDGEEGSGGSPPCSVLRIPDLDNTLDSEPGSWWLSLGHVTGAPPPSPQTSTPHLMPPRSPQPGFLLPPPSPAAWQSDQGRASFPTVPPPTPRAVHGAPSPFRTALPQRPAGLDTLIPALSPLTPASVYKGAPSPFDTNIRAFSVPLFAQPTLDPRPRCSFSSQLEPLQLGGGSAMAAPVGALPASMLVLEESLGRPASHQAAEAASIALGQAAEALGRSAELPPPSPRRSSRLLPASPLMREEIRLSRSRMFTSQDYGMGVSGSWIPENQPQQQQQLGQQLGQVGRTAADAFTGDFECLPAKHTTSPGVGSGSSQAKPLTLLQQQQAQQQQVQASDLSREVSLAVPGGSAAIDLGQLLDSCVAAALTDSQQAPPAFNPASDLRSTAFSTKQLSSIDEDLDLAAPTTAAASASAQGAGQPAGLLDFSSPAVSQFSIQSRGFQPLPMSPAPAASPHAPWFDALTQPPSLGSSGVSSVPDVNPAPTSLPTVHSISSTPLRPHAPVSPEGFMLCSKPSQAATQQQFNPSMGFLLEHDTPPDSPFTSAWPLVSPLPGMPGQQQSMPVQGAGRPAVAMAGFLSDQLALPDEVGTAGYDNPRARSLYWDPLWSEEEDTQAQPADVAPPDVQVEALLPQQYTDSTLAVVSQLLSKPGAPFDSLADQSDDDAHAHSWADQQLAGAAGGVGQQQQQHNASPCARMSIADALLTQSPHLAVRNNTPAGPDSLHSMDSSKLPSKLFMGSGHSMRGAKSHSVSSGVRPFPLMCLSAPDGQGVGSPAVLQQPCPGLFCDTPPQHSPPGRAPTALDLLGSDDLGGDAPGSGLPSRFVSDAAGAVTPDGGVLMHMTAASPPAADDDEPDGGEAAAVDILGTFSDWHASTSRSVVGLDTTLDTLDASRTLQASASAGSGDDSEGGYLDMQLKAAGGRVCGGSSAEAGDAKVMSAQVNSTQDDKRAGSDSCLSQQQLTGPVVQLKGSYAAILCRVLVHESSFLPASSTFPPAPPTSSCVKVSQAPGGVVCKLMQDPCGVQVQWRVLLKPSAVQPHVPKVLPGV